ARQTLTLWEVTGIGGTHALFLHPPPSRMTPLTAPIPGRYAVLEGKHIGRQWLEGSILPLSAQGAAIRASALIPPLSTLKMWIAEIEVGGGPGELYAKVVDESATSESSFVVRFTAMPPEMTQYLGSRSE